MISRASNAVREDIRVAVVILIAISLVLFVCGGDKNVEFDGCRKCSNLKSVMIYKKVANVDR